ncbi:phage tail length tape measure family protein [Ancylobacter polymorphus]|uniref:Bacteriophage tail tape measure N-terminal domain-containing protein n=1 Tax=Ancylobacter polymorphus TaxID=223390 RepID=A0ABU0BIB9_9HYPH|nr:phage tail length tape measure family protein [Ancylobacter polymorphus]MDQ0305344.1 hypothetical protein [Ancylobacter polymorphus]
MASVEEIRRVTVQAKSEGVQQVTNEVNQLSAAQENLARESQTTATVTDMQSRSLLSQEKALERLQTRYDMAYRAQQNMTRDMDLLNKSRGQGLVTDERYAELQGLIAAHYVDTSAGAKAVGDATKFASHEVSNLAAQVTDLGVQVLGGQSFGTAMIQQGPQIAAVMGDRGVKGALVGIGAAMASLVTPTTLLLGGLTVGAYAVAAAFDAMSGSADDVEERLKKHEELVQRIADRYGDARDKAIEFSEARHLNDIADAKENLESLRKAYDEAEKRLVQGLSDKSVSIDTAGNIVQSSGYEAFAEVLAKVRQEAKDGVVDVEGFRAAVWAVMEASSDPAVKALGQDYRALGAEAQKSADGLLAAEGALNKVQSTLGATAAMMDKFRDAMKNFDKDQKILAGMQERLNLGTDPRKQFIAGEVGKLSDTATDDDIAKARELAGRLYDQAEAQKAANSAARDAENRQKQLDRAYERSKQQVDDYVRDIELQTQAFGLSAAETERLRVRQELLTNAQRAGKEATAELYAEIEAYADRAAVAAQKYEDLQKQQDAFNDAANGFAQLGYDAFSGLIQGGKEFGDVVTDLTNKLLEMALQAALLGTGPLAGLFGTTGTNGAPGGILGSLVTGLMGATVPGNAAGNDNWRGGLSIVGEHGPELVNLPKGSQVSPTQDVFGALRAMASMAAAGGGSQVNVQVVNNAGAKVGVEKSTGANGEVNLKLTIDRMVEDAMLNQVQGRGRVARAFETQYPNMRRATA